MLRWAFAALLLVALVVLVGGVLKLGVAIIVLTILAAGAAFAFAAVARGLRR